MPEIKLQHVISCSSEDKRFPAENLTSSDNYKKWMCASKGEKSVTVVFQLEKSSQISKIDVGNENSAFVEVLVGRSSMKEDDYQVILVASSLMSPVESKSGQNGNRVRLFGEDALTKSIAEQKWDRLKVVCTQPFNKNVQYGLAFIRVYSAADDEPDQKVKRMDSPKRQMTLGAFVVKSDSDADAIKAGSLFSNRSKEPESKPAIGSSASVRAASREAEESLPVAQKAAIIKKRALEDDDSPVPVKKRAVEAPKPKVEQAAPSKKREPKKEAKENTGDDTEFSKLMAGVVFALSGFQNPERGDLRDKAVDMGAKYKADWGPGCTHLVCAFANTPKYKQVSGKGCIVKKEWILDSHKKGQLLPWRKYRLGNAPSPKRRGNSDSDESDDGGKGGRKPRQTKRKDQSPAPKAKPAAAKAASDSGTDTYDASDKEDKKKPKAEKPAAAAKADIYEASTEEDEPKEEEVEDTGDVAPLSDIFSNKHFFVHANDMTTDEARTLTRYITAFNGVIENYMNDKVNYVLTVSAWDDTFDKALEEHPNLIFVKPSWIVACNDKQGLVPYQKFTVAVS